MSPLETASIWQMASPTAVAGENRFIDGKLRGFGIQDFVVPQNVEECIPHNFDDQTLLQDCYLLEIWSGY